MLNEKLAGLTAVLWLLGMPSASDARTVIIGGGQTNGPVLYAGSPSNGLQGNPVTVVSFELAAPNQDSVNIELTDGTVLWSAQNPGDNAFHLFTPNVTLPATPSGYWSFVLNYDLRDPATGGRLFEFFNYRNVTVELGNDISVPEPEVWAMMIVGFGLLGSVLRRKPQLNFSRL